ncbi:MAG: sulfatase [Fimbriimonadaceae bacterium]|nr:sulfatase [Fimbriimonadaceae bacterium]
MRVLYLDVDSLRPDHLGCYGYHRNTSPNLDALARTGVRFENLYATDTPCLPSRTAFFLGDFGTTTGVVNHGGRFADLAPTGDRDFRSTHGANALAAVLRRAGVSTCSISPFPFRHTAYQVWYGFEETHDTGKGGLENADEMWVPVERWLRSNGERDDWFLHVNFWDPHTPYDTPTEFGNPFEGDDIDPWITDDVLARQNESFGPHSAAEVPGYDDRLPARWRMGTGRLQNRADAKLHMDGYDTGIRYADAYLGRILDLLDSLGVRDETAIVVSADHGESQGELNVWGDHQTADQSCNRLPLVMVWPGVTDGLAGRAFSGLHYHFDLAASFVEWLGGSLPETHQGVPLTETLRGGPGRPYLVLSHGAWSCQRSVRWGNWLFCRTYHTGLKDLPTWMLFDLEADPHETTNLAGKRREAMGEGLRLMDKWLGDQMPRAPRGDPLWGVVQEDGPLHANERSPEWAAYLDRLRHTGRAYHADRLATFGGRPMRSGLE